MEKTNSLETFHYFFLTKDLFRCPFCFSLLRLKITFFLSSSSFPSFHSPPEIPSIIFPDSEMGKYIKKSKIASGALSIKDISHQTASRFRTRAAKNLALHRLRISLNSAVRRRWLISLPPAPEPPSRQASVTRRDKETTAETAYKQCR